MTDIPTPAVPEIWFKAKRVIRTVLAVVVAIVVTGASALGVFNLVAPQILEQLRELLPPEAYGWLVSTLALLVVVAGALTRIMAIPQVNAFLTKFGAGSVPASAVPALSAPVFLRNLPTTTEAPNVVADSTGAVYRTDAENDPTPSDDGYQAKHADPGV